MTKQSFSDKLKLILIIIVIGISLFGFLFVQKDLRATKNLLSHWNIISIVSIFYISNIWMSLFIVWCVIRNAIYFFQQGDLHIYSLNYLFIIFSYGLFYQIIYKTYKKKYFDIVCNGICLLAIVNFIWMVLQYYGIFILIAPMSDNYGMMINKYIIIMYDYGFRKGYDIIGFFSNRNVTSSFICLAIPCFFRRKWWIFIPSMLVGLLWSDSMGGLAPLIIIWWYIAVFKRYKYKIPLLIASCIAIICVICVIEGTTKINDSGRIALWKNIYNTGILEHPVIGHGNGLFCFKYQLSLDVRNLDHVSGRQQKAHNDYIQCWYEQGAIGLIIVLLLTLCVFRKSYKNKNMILHYGLLIGIINASVNFLAHTTTFIILLMYMAMIEREYDENYKSDNDCIYVRNVRGIGY